MSDYRAECPSCKTHLSYDETMQGQTCDCPQCGQPLVLPAGEPPPSPAQAPAAPTPAALSPANDLPQRMRANKLLAGRVCVHCGKPIDLGDDVINCPDCGGTDHAACRAGAGHCGNANCPSRVAAAAGPTPPPLPADCRPCRFCGEPIKRKARKCRHCGEFQDERDRAAQAKPEAAAKDENLTGGEIAFGILCTTIACIVGLVWAIQGKKKGWKLMGIALLSAIIINVIVAAIKSAQ